MDFGNTGSGHLASGVAGAHAAPAGGSASGSGDVDARWHPQTRDGRYTCIERGGGAHATDAVARGNVRELENG